MGIGEAGVDVAGFVWRHTVQCTGETDGPVELAAPGVRAWGSLHRYQQTAVLILKPFEAVGL